MSCHHAVFIDRNQRDDNKFSREFSEMKAVTFPRKTPFYHKKCAIFAKNQSEEGLRQKESILRAGKLSLYETKQPHHLAASPPCSLTTLQPHPLAASPPTPSPSSLTPLPPLQWERGVICVINYTHAMPDMTVKICGRSVV